MQSYRLIVYGAILLLTAIFMPQGLSGVGPCTREFLCHWKRGSESHADAQLSQRKEEVKRVGSREPILELRDISKRFGGLVALSEISISVAPVLFTVLSDPTAPGSQPFSMSSRDCFVPIVGKYYSEASFLAVFLLTAVYLLVWPGHFRTSAFSKT